MTPKELVDCALENKLTALSITDHDTIAAYAEALPYAKSKGLILGAGVEFSCEYKRKSVHVLAYDFLLDDSELLQYCESHQKRRKERNQKILERLQRLGIHITEEEIINRFEGERTLGRPHIAQVMVEKGYVYSLQQAFQRYLGDKACCFVSGHPFSIEEAIAIIQKAQGKVFLAHPHLYADVAFVQKILELGFHGIECYYGRGGHSLEKTWLRLAKDMGLLISGGSDFHGSVKPHISLGSSYVDYLSFRTIFSRSQLVL
jgi:predicted metal-dependent phosphoesterase TrpH